MPRPLLSKDAVVEYLRRSITLCETVLSGLNDQSALEPTSGPYVRGSHVIAMVGHTCNVYAKLSLMMRAKGLVPPSTPNDN